MISPLLTGPVTGGEFILRRVTLVSCSKRFTALGVALLNLHLWVTKANDLLFAVLTRLNDKLLWSVRGTARLVALHPLLRKSLSFRSISHDQTRRLPPSYLALIVSGTAPVRA